MRKKIALFLVAAFLLTSCSSAPSKPVVKSNPIHKTNTNSASNQTPTSTSSNTNAPTTTPSTSNSSSSTSNTNQNTNTNTNQSSTPKSFDPTVLSDTSSLSTKTNGWSWEYSPKDYKNLLAKYHAYADGDTSKKIIYLTFDEGYENGYSASILDTLKANNVKAAFFVTKPFITASYNGVKDAVLLQRMSKEGHLICNHSVQHKSMPSFTDEKSFDAELTGVENAASSVAGVKISKYFRPPMGEFSDLSLYYTQKLGYKSIFFSLAYNDYDANNQPDPDTAKKHILKYTHPGMICLLHAMSKTNASILDYLIKEWKNEGYEFKTLDELP